MLIGEKFGIVIVIFVILIISALGTYVVLRAFRANVKKKDNKNHICKGKYRCGGGQLELKNQLGSGAYGVVCAGYFKNSENGVKSVAVKIIKPTENRKAIDDVNFERNIMAQLGKHPNIVELHIPTIIKDHDFIVMVKCKYGSILYWYQHFKSDVKLLIKWAIDVANGLRYITSRGFVHNDIAARNIMLDDGPNGPIAKVGDFGLTRRVDPVTKVYKKRDGDKLPLVWSAPECLYNNIYSEVSDVYSFANFMFEICSPGQYHYPGYQMKKPPHATPAMCDLMQNCWHKDPSIRPKFVEIIQQLTRMQ
ncbi:tyrosine kinase receptor Cad96Ca-like [Sitodiplosis mosellana]|uniref:tyrosine kinase receptor Cad96Ca-like n=1 Tax=Sitodiplosis mosellana TaxID=263140 RepID=UPI002443E27E|nr:tyrosine kinase receptor Cad96Ca-like [Sitodiplosis mosellana]